MRVAPDDEIMLITNGGKQALYNAFAALLDPGDEVLLPAPYWTTYPEAIRLAGGVPVLVHAGAEQHFKITPAQLKAALNEWSRLEWPDNAPRSLGELANRVNAPLSDEPYCATASFSSWISRSPRTSTATGLSSTS